MNYSPLLEASFAIQIHVAAAIAAMLLGAAILFRRKGNNAHRRSGRIWVALMALVASSSFFIWTIGMWGPFSPIHLLSVGTLFSLTWGIKLARMSNIIAHKRTMQVTYAGALVLTGFFTLLPDRIMHTVLFGGEQPLAGAAVLATLVVGGVACCRFRGVAKLDHRGGRPPRGAAPSGLKRATSFRRSVPSVTSPSGSAISAQGSPQRYRHERDQQRIARQQQEEVELPERVFNPDYERATLPPELYVPSRY